MGPSRITRKLSVAQGEKEVSECVELKRTMQMRTESNTREYRGDKTA